MAQIITPVEQTAPQPPAGQGRDSSDAGRLRATVILVVMVAVSLLAATAATVILDSSLRGFTLESARPAFERLEPQSVVLVWVVVLAVWTATNRLALAAALVLSCSFLLGAANYQKISLRREPLYPSDVAFLGQPRFLLSQVSATEVALTLVLVVAVAAAAVTVERWVPRVLPRVAWLAPRSRAWWYRVAGRVVALTLLLGILHVATGFNEPGNRVRAVYQSRGAAWAPWDQFKNYSDNGFVGGFLFNMPAAAMSTPRGYSEATMDDLVQRYQQRADTLNTDRAPGALDDVNVVVVLSESFSDPTALTGVELDEDPIPRTRRLMSRTTSGQMLAQRFGGGTANMEFEALTGLSMGNFASQMTTPYQMLLPDLGSFPSAVSWFGAHGHRTVAVHPFTGSFYRRSEVYRTLGFDTFVDSDGFHDAEPIDNSLYAPDYAVFDETVRQVSDSADPLFANVVTMQNHLPFANAYYDPVRVTGDADPAEAGELGNYARGLAHTDQALVGFLRDLRRTGEDAAVVFFGDHLPPILSGEAYEEQSDQALHQTPYFIWSSAHAGADAQPLTSPTQFLPLLFDKLGAQLPPYYAMLEDLHSQITAMENGRFTLTDGRTVGESELPAAAACVLADYRLVQYDLTVGGRYSEHGLWESD